MSPTVVIDRFDARYHDVRPGEVAQLDRALAGLVTAELAAAIDRTMPSSGEEICIPELHISLEISDPHDVRLLARTWADGVVDAIRQHAESSSGVVVYRNRIDALVDFARSTSHGRRERVWAWHQMGLVNSDVSSPSSEHVTRALIAHPEMALGVLQQLVDLREIHLEPSQWIRLAVAVDRLLGSTSNENPVSHQAHSQTVSSSAQALASTLPWSQADDHERFVLARLVVAVSSPERSASHTFVEQLARRWADDIGNIPTGSGDVESERLRPAEPSLSYLVTDDRIEVRERAANTPQGHIPPQPRPDVGDNPNDDEYSADAQTAQATTVRSREAATEHETNTTTGRSTPQQRQNAGHRSDDGPRNPESRAPEGVDEANPEAQPDDDVFTESNAAPNVETSAFGGVVFTPHCLEAIALVQRIVDAGLQLSPSSVLARVLAEISAAEPTDPAVLAMTGCDVDDVLEDPDTDTVTWVGRWSDEIDAWLRDRLDLQGDDSLSWFWRRRAEIRSEPGWIEVDLPLESVDTRIRSAGLDLDPGFVWWLGSVVRYRYV